MRLSCVIVKNFRNFRHLDVTFGDSQSVVFLGENKIGKSNFVTALRLVLDSSMPDSARQLRLEDFHDGIRPIGKGHSIDVVIDFVDFEDQEPLLALLCDYLVSTDPAVARLNYRFRPVESLDRPPRSADDFEFLLFGGEDESNRTTFELRRRIGMTVLEALRDTESDFQRWGRSPMRPLLEAAVGTVPEDELIELAEAVETATGAVVDHEAFRELDRAIADRIHSVVGSRQAFDLSLRIAPATADQLVRSLRLFIDNGQRPLHDASLGSSNVLHLALRMLDIERRLSLGSQDFSIFVIEEPEAHLHPHLQRLVYRDLLHSHDDRNRQTALLTTHSPHVASVAPLDSLVILHDADDGSTVANAAAGHGLSQRTVKDIERYLDVTRSEIFFAQAVILVEGQSEQFLIPRFAELLQAPLDEVGISVCAVAGTHFAAYDDLLEHLNIPHVIVTDGDPDGAGRSLGVKRALRLLERRGIELGKKDTQEVAAAEGIFVNSSTLEQE